MTRTLCPPHLVLAALLALVVVTPIAAQGADDDEAFIARMAQEHEGDEPSASPAAKLQPRQPVATERVRFGDGKTGYLARPAEMPAGESGAPGIIVIHEWWGLNDNIEAMTRRLAGEGYVALAVDFYNGEVATERQDAMRLMRNSSQNPEAGVALLREARDFLVGERDSTSVASIGWCFGGAWSLRAAITLGGDLDAAIIYYGRLTTASDELDGIEAPVLGLFGADDRGIPVSSVKEFEAAMNELDKSLDLHIYDGADHAFANPSGTRYNDEAAVDAWARTTAFLSQHLD